MKLYYKYKRSKQGLGHKVYENDKLELFHMYFGSTLDRILLNNNYLYNPNYEIFIRRKKDKYVYSIGCIDGYGCVKIFKRLKQFFYDCPELIKMVKDKKIDKQDIISIADFYNSSCIN